MGVPIDRKFTGPVPFQWEGEQIVLHPDKAMYLPGRATLLISDAHLGKGQHFRKNGIAVPPGIGHTNLSRIRKLILAFMPERVVFLGDLFHSIRNVVWDKFVEMLKACSGVSFELIPGNHDILNTDAYLQAGLTKHPPVVEIGPFMLSHYPIDDLPEAVYNIAGHIHPAVRLRGKGLQSLTLPCFYFGENGGLMPAFGAFTGLSVIRPRPGEHVFAIIENTVKKLQ